MLGGDTKRESAGIARDNLHAACVGLLTAYVVANTVS